MAGDTEFYLPQKVQDALLETCKKQVLTSGQGTQGGTFDGFNHRGALEAIDREYYRENIFTYDKVQAAYANMRGDKKKLQDIVIPLAESQAETMLAYLVSVFLTGNPIFGVTASPRYIDQAKAFQAILSNQSVYGNWVSELIDNFHNSLKYFGVLEVTWCKEQIYTPEINVDSQGRVNESKTILWEGNKFKNISPYNCFWDRRVTLPEVHKKAEFAGYVELESRTSLKTYIESRAIKMNVQKAYSASIGTPQVQLFYIPDFLWNSLDNLGQSTLRRGSNIIDDFSTFDVGPAGAKKTFKNCYYRVTRYMRIVPSDYEMSVPMKNQVQIWKIVTVNDQVIIEAERQNNNHNLIPLIFSQPTIDGLGYNSKSFVQKQLPLQDIASALLNAAMDTQRRKISDRVLYDPSRVSKENISSSSPTARIPVRPSAYGSDISKAVYKFPFEDSQTASFIGTAKEIMGFGDMISGQNRAQQGQFVKGNKTQAEFEDVQNKSSGRQQKVALKIESQVMQPAKYICKANILQYQPSGEMFNYADQTTVKIDPIELRKAIFTYTITDGLIPEDKIINAQAVQGFLQMIGSSPYLQSKYDMAKVVSYFAKTQNADLTPFEVTPEIAMQQAQQMQQLGMTPGGPPEMPPGMGGV